MSNTKSRFGWLVPLLLVAALVGICVSLFCFYRAYSDANQHLQSQALGFQQQRLSLQLGGAIASGASRADVEPTLNDLRASIDQIGRLRATSGNAADIQLRLNRAFDNLQDALPESGSLAATMLSASLASGEAGNSTDRVLSGVFSGLVETTSALRSQLSRLDAPVMQLESSGHLYQLAVSVQKKVASVDSDKTPAETARGPWLVFDQILKRLEAMLGTGEISDRDAMTLINEIRAQQVELTQVFDNPAAVPAAETAAATGSVDSRLTSGPGYGLGSDSASDIAIQHQLLDDTLDASSAAISDLAAESRLWFPLGLMTALVSSAILGLLCLWLWRRSRAQTALRREAENRQQASILRLLDEISALAEGDLNTRATVSEDMTGAIADSVNYAVGELRRLVGSIMNSADRVTVAVEETGATAQQLANASAVQSREISRSSSYLQAMADTMRQVSGRSAEASSIAKRSVELASSGREAVQRTEIGMTSIRKQCVKTKSVLKRLGDSSKQIGRTVNLVNEVSEKTRLLAMNSAIQASTRSTSAGDASRVADQVQTLASTLAHCTAEINNLVAIIQQDIAIAITTMEDTNNEVLGVSRLAEQADESLTEIQDVSVRLSVVVDHLTGRVRRQSGVVDQLSTNMGVINDVTQHSAHGLRLSASALEDLRLMANELRDGVSDFSLPEADNKAIARRSAAINGRLGQSREMSSRLASSAGVASAGVQSVSTRPGVTKRSIVLEETEMTQVIERPESAENTSAEALADPVRGRDTVPDSQR